MSKKIQIADIAKKISKKTKKVAFNYYFKCNASNENNKFETIYKITLSTLPKMISALKIFNESIDVETIEEANDLLERIEKENFHLNETVNNVASPCENTQYENVKTEENDVEVELGRDVKKIVESINNRTTDNANIINETKNIDEDFVRMTLNFDIELAEDLEELLKELNKTRKFGVDENIVKRGRNLSDSSNYKVRSVC